MKSFRALTLATAGVVAISLGLSQASAQGAAEHALGDRQALLSSRDRLQESVEKVSTFKAREALIEIERNMSVLRQVREKVEGSKNVDEVIEDVSAALEVMATSYEKIAAMKTEIEITYKGETRNLDEVGVKTGRTLAEIRAEKARCEQELRDDEGRLPAIANLTERKKMEIRIRSLKSQINQWAAKETIWSKFEQAQGPVKQKLSITGEHVDLLIFLLQENAKVYRGAASVAKLRKSARETLNNFVDFQDLNDAAGNLEGTWSELDGIVDRMASDDFVLGPESTSPLLEETEK
jgi:hypothetical protein